MNPAFSVIFLTTLIGVGQGLFVAMVTGQSISALGFLPEQSNQFYVFGSMVVIGFLIAGLVASFFHLGHPERAWRTAAMWRTSWLSREVIVLPLLMGMVMAYGLIHYFGWALSDVGIADGFNGDLALVMGVAGVVISFALFICTGMIYACIKFLQEWSHPLTVINFTLFGLCSGFLLATSIAQYRAPDFANLFGGCSLVLLFLVLITRVWSLYRNSNIRPKSTLQSAIGVRHNKIQQKSQGFMGGSVNTRDFFHHVGPMFFKSIKWIFLLLVFPVAMTLLISGMMQQSMMLLAIAFVLQYIGLLAERWFFFAQANHPQNLYYQTIS
ncbi:MAG: dimethyl sulfoxide reductase anchor subunit family protein [Gammaproteobacteria bacterium]